MKNNIGTKILHIDKANYTPIATVKQEDNITMTLELYKEGVEFDITRQTVTLAAKRSDKVIIEQIDGFIINNNTLTINLKNNIIAKIGLVYLELIFTDEAGSMTTLDFYLKVNGKILGEDSLDASDNIASLEKVKQDFINSSNALLEDATENENTRVQAEKIRKNDEETRNRSETSRTNAETKRVEAEKIRVDEENLRAAAEEERVAAERIRDEKVEEISSQCTKIENDFDEVIANVTNGNESATNSEIVQARGGEVNLNKRLDKFDTQLSDKANEVEVRKKNIKINEFDITDSLKQSIAGTASIYSSVAPKNVTPLKTTFIKTGLNLLNEDTIKKGYFIDRQTGEAKVNSNYNCTDFIFVGDVFKITRKDSLLHYAYYDEHYRYLCGGEEATQTLTIPPNAIWIRLSIETWNMKDYMVINGDAMPSYFIPYTETIDEKFIESIPSEKLSTRINKEQMNYISISRNLFNKQWAVPRCFVSSENGNLKNSPNYNATNYIKVERNTNYIISWGHQIAFYNKDKKYISGVNGGGVDNYKLTTPANAEYIRCTLAPWNIDTFQISKGENPVDYEDYKCNFVNVDSSDEVFIVLPNEICVAVGRTIEIYNKQVVCCGNINNYHLKWDCEIGKALKRKFSIKGIIATTKTLNLTVYNNNMRVVAKASTVIKVVPVLTANKTILTIGDSLTNEKPWLAELQKLSGNKLMFVGTRGTGTLKHEGRSGFSARNYLTKMAYDYEHEGIQPFWNDSKNRFDWNYYKTTTGVSPDAINIFLGTNGMKLDPYDNANDIKNIVDFIRMDDSNIPIFITNTIFKGDQNGLGNQEGTDGYSANKGAWKLEEDRKVFNLMKELYKILGTYTNLYFIPVATCHDSEYNFGNVEVSVNPRAIQKEHIPSEATHPQEQGYMQIADVAIGVFSSHI